MYAYVIAEQITFGDKFHDKIKLKKKSWIASSRCYLRQFAMNLEFCLKLYNIFSKPTLEEEKILYSITLLLI